MHPYGTVSIQMWLLRSQGQREMPRKGRLPRGENTRYGALPSWGSSSAAGILESRTGSRLPLGGSRDLLGCALAHGC